MSDRNKILKILIQYNLKILQKKLKIDVTDICKFLFIVETIYLAYFFSIFFLKIIEIDHPYPCAVGIL